jgi:hypothetical protein
MLRNVAALLAAGCVLVSTASAALTTSVTLSRNPTGNPPVNFATDTGLNSAPNNGWVSYVLGVSNSSGVITGIDATISGNMFQRWSITESDEGDVITPSPAITGTTNGDSHLLPVPTALVGRAFSENNNVNNGLQAFPSDTATRDYGIGSSLSGAWGIPGADQTSAINFAYVVIPKSAIGGGGILGPIITGLDLTVHVGLPGGQFATLTTDDFFPVGLAPDVRDVELNAYGTSGITLVDVAPGSQPVTWSALTGPYYTPGFGEPPGPTVLYPGYPLTSWNPTTQQFSYQFLGRNGTYVWTGTASNAFGSDPFKITIYETPEPGTATLFGLALVGCLGSCRRRYV